MKWSSFAVENPYGQLVNIAQGPFLILVSNISIYERIRGISMRCGLRSAYCDRMVSGVFTAQQLLSPLSGRGGAMVVGGGTRKTVTDQNNGTEID